MRQIYITTISRPWGAQQFWHRASDFRRVRFRFQTPPKTHRLHAVYVIVNSVVPKVSQLVVTICVVSEEKFPSPVRDISKCWRCRWMVLLSVVRGRNRIHTIVKNGPRSSRIMHPFTLNPIWGLAQNTTKTTICTPQFTSLVSIRTPKMEQFRIRSMFGRIVTFDWSVTA